MWSVHEYTSFLATHIWAMTGTDWQGDVFLRWNNQSFEGPWNLVFDQWSIILFIQHLGIQIGIGIAHQEDSKRTHRVCGEGEAAKRPREAASHETPIALVYDVNWCKYCWCGLQVYKPIKQVIQEGSTRPFFYPRNGSTDMFLGFLETSVKRRQSFRKFPRQQVLFQNGIHLNYQRIHL